MHLRESCPVRAAGNSARSCYTLGISALRCLHQPGCNRKNAPAVCLSHTKRLLEWQTSSDSEGTTRADLAGFYFTMWIAPFRCNGNRAVPGPRATQPTVPGFSRARTLARRPWIAWWISQPIESREPELNAEQLDFLRRTARKTWYSSNLCHSPGELASPGQFPGSPRPRIASRTSPTNMGLALLSNLAARDLGYLPWVA